MVEKKSPLVLPPDYEDLPLPNTKDSNINVKDTTIKTLITDKEIESDKIQEVLENNTFEENILKKIKNN